MTVATTNARLGELRAQHEEAQSRLARLRTILGAAVADADEVLAATTRAEMETMQRTIDELAAALPIVEERASEAQRQADAERRAAAVRLHSERREQKLAAAAKVDEALAALGAAWAAFESLPEVSNRAARNRGFALRAALLHWAPTLSAALDLRRVPGPHFRPFAKSEDSATPTTLESKE